MLESRTWSSLLCWILVRWCVFRGVANRGNMLFFRNRNVTVHIHSRTREVFPVCLVSLRLCSKQVTVDPYRSISVLCPFLCWHIRDSLAESRTSPEHSVTALLVQKWGPRGLDIMVFPRQEGFLEEKLAWQDTSSVDRWVGGAWTRFWLWGGGHVVSRELVLRGCGGALWASGDRWGNEVQLEGRLQALNRKAILSFTGR